MQFFSISREMSYGLIFLRAFHGGRTSLRISLIDWKAWLFRFQIAELYSSWLFWNFARSSRIACCPISRESTFPSREESFSSTRVWNSVSVIDRGLYGMPVLYHFFWKSSFSLSFFDRVYLSRIGGGSVRTLPSYSMTRGIVAYFPASAEERIPGVRRNPLRRFSRL